MAASRTTMENEDNIPEYEYVDVNTNVFHIGSFQSEWLKRLSPQEWSYQQQDETEFDANFAKDMQINAQTMDALKSVCRYINPHHI